MIIKNLKSSTAASVMPEASQFGLMAATLNELKKAKQYSDVKQYEQKHQLVYDMVKKTPHEFYIDSEDGDIVGLTHASTGFKMHIPKSVIDGLEVENKAFPKKLTSASSAPTAKAAAKMLAPIPTGFGQINTSVKKAPSQFGALKSQLTKATNRISIRDSKRDAPANPQAELFPATAKYYLDKQNKQAELTTGSIMRGLGYSPGLWYQKGDYSPDAQTRFGNIVTGAGLAGLGMLSIPILKTIFPKRFEGKGKNLAALALLGGFGAPWLANMPSTVADLNRLFATKNENWTSEDKQKMITNMRMSSGVDPTLGTYGIKHMLPNSKKSSFIPMDMQIAKTHIADVLSEQLSSGYVDYGQAAGLMARAAKENNKPWVTVKDLTRAAVGAGAGGLAGMVAAKGIGMFMNLTPSEQNTMRNTGAAIGTLISLGKLGF
jgi:hypothetical protein